jgi:hypothetical protein
LYFYLCTCHFTKIQFRGLKLIHNPALSSQFQTAAAKALVWLTGSNLRSGPDILNHQQHQDNVIHFSLYSSTLPNILPLLVLLPSPSLFRPISPLTSSSFQVTQIHIFFSPRSVCQLRASYFWISCFNRMGSRPVTPLNEAYTANAPITSRPRTTNSRPNSYLGTSVLEQGHRPQMDSSPLSQSLHKQEDIYGLRHNDDGSVHDGHQNMTGGELRRSSSQTSQSQTMTPSRGGTLKKKASLRRTGSLKRSSSRRSSRAGSVRSLVLGEKEKYGEGEEFNSAFHTPVPTASSPTDILANRFQGPYATLQILEISRSIP